MIIDEAARTLAVGNKVVPLYSREAFEEVSRIWLKVGWNERYSYGFTWMGRQVLQSPEDMIRMQAVVWETRPTVIIETGVAHGGSLLYWASVLDLMSRQDGESRCVIGVEKGLLRATREAIEGTRLSRMIELVEGDSVAEKTLAQVHDLVHRDDKVMVFLDSNHSKDHVLAELDAYAPLVNVGSYIVAQDGLMSDLHDVPRGRPEWREDNPVSAVKEFASKRPDFELDEMASMGAPVVTHHPMGWLKRVV